MTARASMIAKPASLLLRIKIWRPRRGSAAEGEILAGRLRGRGDAEGGRRGQALDRAVLRLLDFEVVNVIGTAGPCTAPGGSGAPLATPYTPKRDRNRMITVSFDPDAGTLYWYFTEIEPAAPTGEGECNGALLLDADWGR